MSVITAIQPTPRRPGRFEILVDGSPAAILSIDAIERLALAVGVSIAGMEERLATEAAQLHVFDRAINMLAFRARSSTELARLLGRKGEEKQHVAAAIARLKDQ